MVGRRVVLIPGLMGSALYDISTPIDKAKIQAAANWDKVPKIKEYFEKNGNQMVGEDSDLAWGRFQFLHWLGNLEKWLELMSSGDGYSDSFPVLPKGLTELIIQQGQGNQPYRYQPYAAMVDALTKTGADVLIHDFDWRMRAEDAVIALQFRILSRWWKEKMPERPVAPLEKVLLVGHSLGGLVARLFVEHPACQGDKLVRHAIMVGTPNKGSPNAFGYFTGTKDFFQDTPLFKAMVLLQKLQKWFNASLPAGQRDKAAITPQMMGKEEAQRLVEVFSSIIQLFPSYDFVTPIDDKTGTKKHPYAETYRNRKHKKTGKDALKILEELDDPLREGRSLDSYLTRAGVTYDFVGATGFSTAIGMKEIRAKPFFKMESKKKKGDGTVPTSSSIDWIRAEKGLNSISFLEIKGKAVLAEHAELCRHPDVLKLALKRLKESPVASKSKRIKRADVALYREILKTIIKDKKGPLHSLHTTERNRTLVVCFGLIEGSAPDRMLYTPEFDTVDGKLLLANPPAGVAKPATVYSGKSGKFRYQYVELTKLSDSPSGIMFLPVKGENFIHVFGVIAKPWDVCSNKGHAEKQVLDWIEAQRRERYMDENIAKVLLWNESLTSEKPDRGFSPCRACCDDLQAIWRPKNLTNLFMHWNEVFVGGQRCKNNTTRESLGLMEKKGWDLRGPRPPP